MQAQGGEVEFNEFDNRNIMTAALCHDIGHGPFSHTFDNNFIQVRFPELNWSHEQCGVDLIEYVIDKNNIDNFEKSDIRMVQDLIIGKPMDECEVPNSLLNNSQSRHYEHEEGWMFDIVNNKRNSIDVDKFDYIDRDTYRLGLLNYSYDNSKLMNGARIINGEIWYPYDAGLSIHDLFVTRYKLFRDIYTHKTTQSVELMIWDIFENSNDYFKFDEKVQNMEEYWKLTDKILTKIKYTKHPSLIESQKIIKRIENRDLYKLGAKYVFTQDEKSLFAKITPEKIAEYSDGTVDKDEIKVVTNKYNYALDNRHPMDYVKYYYHENTRESFNVKKEKFSGIMPARTVEFTLNVFCKGSEYEDGRANTTNRETVNKAFLKWAKELTGINIEKKKV